MKTPDYIIAFMGDDFRKHRGVDVSFNLKDYHKNNSKKLVDRRKGCYIISSTRRKFSYAKPGEKSPIIYIGMADDLYRRLHDEHYLKHLKLLMDDPDFGLRSNRIIQMSDKYQYMFYCGAHVDVYYCSEKQDLKEFESSLIANFYCRYRSMPVGNGARSFSQKK